MTNNEMLFKKYVTACFRVLSLFVVMFVPAKAFANSDAVYTGLFNNIAIKGYDSVAYFTESKPVKGNKKYKTVWHGATWHFSSAKNLALFEESPDNYAPQYGGWCAYAMSDKGRTVSTDPKAWRIYEGKLYLNYNLSVQKAWLEDVDKNIKEADTFYPQTTNIKTFK